MTAMPAVCEVGACGVLAVGRCVQCSEAFCGSHQGRSILDVYINLCGPCAIRQAHDRREKDPATRAERVLAGAVERLTALGVPQITILSVSRTNERKAFGRYVPRVNIESRYERHGWLLGPVTWRFTIENQGIHDAPDMRTTALLDGKYSSYSIVGEGMVPVRQTELGWEMVFGQRNTIERMSAAQAISRLEEQYSGRL